MTSLWVIFLTGLTTGGLSCMAVQGGFITGSLAQQIESQFTRQATGQRHSDYHLVFPILVFLIAKLIAYTILGFFLGLLGSTFSLSPVTKGIFQLAIAIFMLGNSLRILNVAPIFRYFTFEPPSFITRAIRRRSKTSGSFITPLTLGAMTVLIPCGITQAMMALAISTGNPFSGAMIMFAFILGTSPVFFALTYLATRLSSLLEKFFLRFVAMVLLILAIIGLNSGLNLLGSTFTLNNIPQVITSTWAQLTHSREAISAAPNEANSRDLKLNVTNTGYSPGQLYAPANQPLKLHLITDHTTACSLDFTIPAFNTDVLLQQTGERVLDLPPLQAGTKLHFSCSMGMYAGDIIAVNAKD